MGDLCSIPGSGRSPGEGNGKPTPVFLPGKSHGWRSLVGYGPRGHKESDTTEQRYFLSFLVSADLRAKPHCCKLLGARRIKKKKELLPQSPFLDNLEKENQEREDLSFILICVHGSEIGAIIESKAEYMKDIINIRDNITISAIIWIFISFSIYCYCMFSESEQIALSFFLGFHL